MTMRMRNRSAGFTLLELMVVVAVAALLVAIAVPTYQNQIRHSRRTDAKTALLDMAVREEKFLTLNNSYTTTASALGYPSLPTPIGNGYYTMYVCVGTAFTVTTTPCAADTGTTGASFVVAAVAVTGQSQAADTSCLYYAVDSTGAQFSANNTAGTGGVSTASTCWQ